MKARILQSKLEEVEADALILPLFENEEPQDPLLSGLDGQLQGLLQELRETSEWKGKAGTLTVLHRPSGLRLKRLVLAGAGKKQNYSGRTLRQLLYQAVSRMRDHQLRHLAVCPRAGSDSGPLMTQAAIEGVLLAAFAPDEFKTVDRSQLLIQEVSLVMDQSDSKAELERALERGRVIGHSTNLTRSLVNAPGNTMKPAVLADRAGEIASESGLQIEVWNEEELRRRGMNAVLAVAEGSEAPPRLIILRHPGSGNEQEPPLVLVGKGVTFDSGGLSLKPAQSMEEMKCDKAGACAVLGAMQALAQLQTPRNVIGLLPCVENLPGGRALRPGDVIRTASGKTVEVLNTDAEGRLILADALHHATQLSPAAIFDLATLTGACIVALGHQRAGLFCNNDTLYEEVTEASRRAGERLWRLPLDEEYRREIESQVADIKNVGSRWGGAVTAAKFLQEFVGDVPWCHVDMAGVDLYPEGEGKGPTGFGVRTMVELASMGS